MSANEAINEESTARRIKRVIISALNLEGMTPEEIENDAPLFGEGLGLDSVDALELVVALEKEYGIRIDSEEIGQEAFASVTALVGFVQGLQAAAGQAAAGPAAAETPA